MYQDYGCSPHDAWRSMTKTEEVNLSLFLRDLLEDNLELCAVFCLDIFFRFASKFLQLSLQPLILQSETLNDRALLLELSYLILTAAFPKNKAEEPISFSTCRNCARKAAKRA